MTSRAFVKVSVTDKGARRTVEQLFGKRDSAVRIGVFGPEGEAQAEKANITVAELAAVHEFGLGNVPERSFIRSYFDAKGAELGNKMLRMIKALLDKCIQTGQPIQASAKRNLLAKVGMLAVAEIQQRIANSEITPPLLPETIKRKGSSVPLIDTGQLRSSITYAVDL